ncbi:MAG: DUF721 domain-containing protein [Holosporales bacterium]|jgi:hypothetical protein|nr:DUF721 domain-containing protein [Holosporales bacterium]
MSHTQLIYSQYAPIGKSLQKIVAPIYKKHGMFKAELFLDWTKIVGGSFPDVLPVRLSGSDAAGYCLYLQASPSVAAQVVYFIPNILDRIRQHFGSQVIKEIRLINGPCLHKNLPPKDKTAENGAEQAMKPTPPAVVGISYPPLKSAIERLFAHVM